MSTCCPCWCGNHLCMTMNRRNILIGALSISQQPVSLLLNWYGKLSVPVLARVPGNAKIAKDISDDEEEKACGPRTSSSHPRQPLPLESSGVYCVLVFKRSAAKVTRGEGCRAGRGRRRPRHVFPQRPQEQDDSKISEQTNSESNLT